MSRYLSASNEPNFAAKASTTPASVDGVNAHLRTFPRDHADFRVVLTFHHLDGSLCEAELTRDDATRLLSEIVRVIHQGKDLGGCPSVVGEAEM